MPDSIFARLTWQPEDAPEVQHILFPIQHWLFEKGSLTARLKQRCHQFEVKVQSEKWIEKTFENETALLPAESYWCREVVLYGDGEPWVAARTLISKDLLTHYQSLSTLGNKPIGEWLFSLSAQRGGIQWAKDLESGLYARRSLFLVQEMPLLISELFLEHSLISE
jgi:probable chorismate--pyruvate lyase